MQITKNIVRDLLPIYLSGEASPETKALVEEFLKTDPVLAEEARLAGMLHLPSIPPPAPDAERAALEETRRLLKNRSATLAIAILFTVLPLTFAVNGTHVTFLLIRDAPIIGGAWWLTAAVMWTWYVAIRRRLSVTNL